MYKVVCIGSRVIPHEVKDRAVRLLDILCHEDVRSGLELRLLATRFTPFESFFFEEYTNRGIGTYAPASQSGRQGARLVRAIHPAPRKLSRKNFKQLIQVAIAVDEADLVIAVPRGEKGRGAFAIRLATALHKAHLDLISETGEQNIRRTEKELAVLDRQREYAEEQREKARAAKLEALKERFRQDPHLSDHSPEVVEIVMRELESRYNNNPSFNPTGLRYVMVRAREGQEPAVSVSWMQDGPNPYVGSVWRSQDRFFNPADRQDRERARTRAQAPEGRTLPGGAPPGLRIISTQTGRIDPSGPNPQNIPGTIEERITTPLTFRNNMEEMFNDRMRREYRIEPPEEPAAFVNEPAFTPGTFTVTASNTTAQTITFDTLANRNQNEIEGIMVRGTPITEFYEEAIENTDLQEIYENLAEEERQAQEAEIAAIEAAERALLEEDTPPEPEATTLAEAMEAVSRNQNTVIEAMEENRRREQLLSETDREILHRLQDLLVNSAERLSNGQIAEITSQIDLIRNRDE